MSRRTVSFRHMLECMSHFVYDLRSWPLVRDRPARLHGQITSDHCRSDLITGRSQWARAGYPFPEVNLPEEVKGHVNTIEEKKTNFEKFILRAIFAFCGPYNESRWPSNCPGLHGHHVMRKESIDGYCATKNVYTLV